MEKNKHKKPMLFGIGFSSLSKNLYRYPKMGFEA